MALSSSSSLQCFYVIIVLATILATTSAQDSPQDFLDAHNAARAEVGVAALVWNDTAAAYAQNYANQLAGSCVLTHSNSNGLYGENLYGGPGGRELITAADAVDAWVEEKQYYDYDSNTCATGQICGHYTQVVWANSLSVGCGVATCDLGGIIFSCNYAPPGNWEGERPY